VRDVSRRARAVTEPLRYNGCAPHVGEQVAMAPQQHAAITGRAGSHARTKANIAEAVRRSIPLRAGVIDLTDDQRSAQAVVELTELGVPDVGVDMLRQVGRGVSDTTEPECCRGHG
jgi:hypothetical protein